MRIALLALVLALVVAVPARAETVIRLPLGQHFTGVAAAPGQVWVAGYSRLARLTSDQLLSDEGAAERCDISVPAMSFPDARKGRISLRTLRRVGLRVASGQPAALTGCFALAGRHVYVHKAVRKRHGVVRVHFPHVLLRRAGHRLAAGHTVELVPEAGLYDPSGNAGRGRPLRVVR